MLNLYKKLVTGAEQVVQQDKQINYYAATIYGISNRVSRNSKESKQA